MEDEVRLDKWLWAARFFKSRAAAADAVAGGKVHVNGARAKPAKTIRAGDEVGVRRGIYEHVVAVRGVSERRGPAAEAARLYDETEESRSRREEVAARARLEAPAGLRSTGRPSKKDRREIFRLIRG